MSSEMAAADRQLRQRRRPRRCAARGAEAGVQRAQRGREACLEHRRPVSRLAALLEDGGSPFAPRRLQDGMKVQWNPLYITEVVERHIKAIGGKLDAVSAGEASMQPLR